MNLPFVKTYLPELKFALDAVHQAAGVVRTVRAGMVEAAFTKGDASPVTVADFAAQALTGCLLKKYFPLDGLVGEETSENLRKPEGASVLESLNAFLSPVTGEISSECICDWIDHGSQISGRRFWTMDPIDGTKGFIRGDQYAVALALVEDGKVKVGVLGCPNLTDSSRPEKGGEGSLVCAVEGQGTWRTSLTNPGIWHKVQVSGHKDGASLVLLRSFETKHTDSPKMKRFMELLGIQTEPVLMDSLAKYAVLAAGAADVMLRFPTQDHPHEWIWDQAAGILVIEEAGGKITDLDGKPLNLTTGRRLTANRGVLLSNGHLHSRILEVLRQV